MEFANFEEFWKALGRPYDGLLEMKESIIEHRQSGKEDRESIKDLSEATKRLLSAVEKQHEIVVSHERRPDRSEITVEAILEDLRRHREQRPSQ
jgi:hypothetical protein